MDQIAIIGFPSNVGGADTELDHQIHVWMKMGLRVHIIPTNEHAGESKKSELVERGCILHEPGDWKACKGMPAISYCNDQFLTHIARVREYATHVFWANCMSWIFPDEKKAHEEGMIDWFIYQTERVRDLSVPILSNIGNSPVQNMIVKPYFHADAFPYTKDRHRDFFRFCRVSREDADKFHEAQLWVYETMVAPVLKQGVILGFNDRICKKIGNLPNWIEGAPAGACAVQEVYSRSHALIHMADPSQTENLPRVGFEAMAMGCVLCVDDRGGWQAEVVHGQTGFLCKDQRAFVYYASRLAFEPGERSIFAENARDHLVSNWGMDAAIASWSKFFSAALR